MPDMEKVIKGLECHAKGAKGCLFDCPYGNENGCQLLLCSDAIALLKEQEDEKPDIVRCKDCKWRGTYACFCIARDDVQDDWFCSEGERK